MHGNLGRNIAFGPGYYEIDTALQKEFPMTERLRLKFRVEAFNLFNHPAYDVPSNVWTEVGNSGDHRHSERWCSGYRHPTAHSIRDAHRVLKATR